MILGNSRGKSTKKAQAKLGTAFFQPRGWKWTPLSLLSTREKLFKIKHPWKKVIIDKNSYER